MKYLLEFEFTATHHAVATCCHALIFYTIIYGLSFVWLGVSTSNLPGFQAEFCRDMMVPLLDLD